MWILYLKAKLCKMHLSALINLLQYFYKKRKKTQPHTHTDEIDIVTLPDDFLQVRSTIDFINTCKINGST